MNLCLIIPSFYPATVYGGPIYSIYPACKEVANLGLTVNVATTNANGKTKLNVETGKPVLLEENLSVHYYNETIIGRLSFPFIFGVKNEIKVSDVVHIQAVYSVPTPVALFWSKLYHKPILFSPRGSFNSWALLQRKSFKILWLIFLIRPLVKNIHWHATSEKEKQEILELFPNAKISVIPNGIYLNQYKFQKISKEEFVNQFSQTSSLSLRGTVYFDTSGKQSLFAHHSTPSLRGTKQSPHHPTPTLSLAGTIYSNTSGKQSSILAKKVENVNRIIVSMGRIHKVKAFDVLIKAFGKILIEYPNSYLFIAGNDDGEKENLIKIIDELNLQENVFFTGQLDNERKAMFLGNADVFALASHTENFGNVYAEALACGTPIVASTNTPWQEVEKAGCGRWVPNTVNETMVAMLDLLNRDREILRINSFKFAEKFEWKNISQSFIQTYNSISK